MNKDNYDELPILPWLVAETVANKSYTGAEWSPSVRNSYSVEKVEALRAKMTVKDIQDFSEWADARCREAYKRKALWFMKIANSKTNSGRDQLYVWVSHWLSSWLSNPAKRDRIYD